MTFVDPSCCGDLEDSLLMGVAGVKSKQSSERGSKDDYRQDRKTVQETDTAGLQVLPTAAASVLLIASLYYRTSGSKATS